ncbi:MAG TPA: TatD family hydrolase [Candidatus Eisenbacteria bacterium]|nr:TatD family hydrolase [Candidatus Eisenbacteria bacterium]
MPRYIDTHCHLDSEIYSRDLDIVVKAALDQGVWIVTLGSDYESSKRAIEIAEKYPEGVFAAVGLHPSKVGANLMGDDQLLDVSRYAQLADHPKVVALGETGLDYHDLPEESRTDPKYHVAEQIKANQRQVFGQFLDLSRDLRLPLLLHCRDAHDDMLGMLETWDKTTRGFDSRGILHCFSGSWRDARKYFNLDFLISVTGIVTHGAYQTEVIKKSPASRLVVESDCPYLTPVPWSIRRNEPGYLPSVADGVAAIRGEAPGQFAVETTKNALKVFTKMTR